MRNQCQSMKPTSVLIVDDEQTVCNLLSRELSERGYLCTTILSGDDALTMLLTHEFDIVLLDIRLPRISGLDILTKIWPNQLSVAIIIITAVNEVGTAVEAMKLGAWDYIVKPFDMDTVDASIRLVLETQKSLPEETYDKMQYFANGIGGELNKPTSVFSAQMDAIARGVEIEYDVVMGYSKTIIHRTIQIARQLDIPERQIQRWANLRETSIHERNEIIESSLEKFREYLLPDTQRNYKTQRKIKLWSGIPNERAYDRAEISGLLELP